MVEIEISSDSPYVEGTITEYEDGTMTLDRDASKEIPQEAGDKLYTIVEGDTFDNLAGREYGNSKLWHVIARANPLIFNFFNLVPGTDIRIPNPENYKP